MMFSVLAPRIEPHSESPGLGCDPAPGGLGAPAAGGPPEGRGRGDARSPRLAAAATPSGAGWRHRDHGYHGPRISIDTMTRTIHRHPEKSKHSDISWVEISPGGSGQSLPTTDEQRAVTADPRVAPPGEGARTDEDPQGRGPPAARPASAGCAGLLRASTQHQRPGHPTRVNRFELPRALVVRSGGAHPECAGCTEAICQCGGLPRVQGRLPPVDEAGEPRARRPRNRPAACLPLQLASAVGRAAHGSPNSVRGELRAVATHVLRINACAPVERVPRWRSACDAVGVLSLR